MLKGIKNKNYAVLNFVIITIFFNGCATLIPQNKTEIISQFQKNDTYTISKNIELDKRNKALKCKYEIIPTPDTEFSLYILLLQGIYTKFNSCSAGQVFYEDFDFSNDKITLNIKQKAMEHNIDLLAIYSDRILNKQESNKFNPIRLVTFLNKNSPQYRLSNITNNRLEQTAWQGAEKSYNIELIYQDKNYMDIAGFLSKYPPVIVIPSDNIVFTGPGEIDIKQEIAQIKKKIFADQLDYLTKKCIDIITPLENNNTVILQISDDRCLDDKMLSKMAEEHKWLRPYFLFANSFPEAQNVFSVKKMPEFIVLYKNNLSADIKEFYDKYKMFKINLECREIKKEEGIEELLFKKILSGKQ